MNPTLSRIGKPAPLPAAADPGPDARRLLTAVERALAKEAPPVARVGWRFVPIRDADKLIVEIVATPFDLKE